VSGDERQALRKKRRRRRLVSRFFGELLESLFEGRSLPELPDDLRDDTMGRIKALASDLMELHAEYGAQL